MQHLSQLRYHDNRKQKKIIPPLYTLDPSNLDSNELVRKTFEGVTVTTNVTVILAS